MARPLRLEFPGAARHITSRGMRRRFPPRPRRHSEHIDGLWLREKGGVVLGGEDFVKRLEPLLWERLVTKPSLEELFAGVKVKEDRDARIYRAAVVYGYRLAEVGAELGRNFPGEPDRGRTETADVKSKDLTPDASLQSSSQARSLPCGAKVGG